MTYHEPPDTRSPLLSRWLWRGASEALPVARWERVLVLAAMTLVFVLGTARLSAPSLWHDELVHVFVAKSITQTLQPRLPGGALYANANAYNYVLAGFIALLGDGEFAVRLPSALFAALNVLLTYVLVRKLLGRQTALVAAFMLAVSPWSVGWSREARFYAMQQSCYLLMLLLAWQALQAETPRRAVTSALGGSVAFATGVLTSIHSVLFLAPVAVYAALRAAWDRRLWSRWVLACVLIAVLGATALGLYFLLAPPVDRSTVFERSGVGGRTVLSEEDHVRSLRFYYLHWLNNNLSTGFLLLGLAGSMAVLVREGHRGLFAWLAFWGPFLILTYLVGYRRERFLFFAYPFLVTAQAYAIVEGMRFLKTWRRSWTRTAAALLIIAFGVRLAWSAVQLAGDSFEAARGHDITLARHHPPWRGPCQYVREHLDEETVVITTTALPVLYYTGRVDQWFPSRIMWWEAGEIGFEGLEDTAALAAYLEQHPKGYFIEHIRRLSMWERQLGSEIAFVKQRMRLIEEASEDYVRVYSWGL